MPLYFSAKILDSRELRVPEILSIPSSGTIKSGWIRVLTLERGSIQTFTLYREQPMRLADVILFSGTGKLRPRQIVAAKRPACSGRPLGYTGGSTLHSRQSLLLRIAR